MLLIFNTNNIFSAPQRINLFNPYEWIFDKARFDTYPDQNDGIIFSPSIRFEQSIVSDGYIVVNDEIESSNTWRTKVNPLKYLGEYENLYAAFLGNKKNSSLSSIANQYTRNNGFGTQSSIDFTGDVSCQAFNINLETFFTREFKIGWYVPLYTINISNFNYKIPNNEGFFEQYNNDMLKNMFESYGFKLKKDSFGGIGDSLLLMAYQDGIIERRDFITGITYGARLGFHLPTKCKNFTYEDNIIQVPLGNDAAWGIAFGGSLEVDLGKNFGFGISADCIKMYGEIKQRRIKTDVRQNNILLLTKELSYIDPGFQESFTLYTSYHDSNKKYTGTLAYQYFKQNDSEIIICSDYFSSTIANTHEKLEPWTTHHIVAVGTYKPDIKNNNIDPLISIFGKYGFNGSRSIVISSIGFELGILF